MLYVVGLGNPGTQYKKTRHNIGAIFVDTLVDIFGLPHLEYKKNITQISQAEIFLVYLLFLLFRKHL